MINEKYADGPSLLHSLDPRLKLIITVLSAFTIAMGNNMVMLCQALVLAVILLIMAKLKFSSLLKRLLVINTFIIFIWIFIPFTYPGEVIFQIGSLSLSREGIGFALRITIRSNAIMLLVITLLSTSSISALIHAMKYLYIPAKLIYLFFFVYRYLHVIKDEFKRLHNSMLIRAFKAKTNFHTYRSYAYLIAVLLIRSYDRSKQVYEAMLCRGFKGKFYMIDNFSMNRKDFIFSAASLISIIWLIALERGWVII